MPSLRPLLDSLTTRVEASSAAHAAQIARVDPVHRPGAVNLVRYMELRSQDAVEIQEGLTALGATPPTQISGSRTSTTRRGTSSSSAPSPPACLRNTPSTRA
ncbi:hypothetical protein ACGLFO_08150 [Corynebacterium hesseae]|uniref:hypothetical protein n=1 Tax=Corynebacterium hesseae TaxID=2913502 RepID=UPI00373E89D8